MRPKPVLLGLILSLGCGASLEDSCTIDSDCKPGLVCSFDGQCVKPDSVVSTINSDTKAPQDSDENDTPKNTVACQEHRGVFLSQDTQCLEPTSIHQITKIALATDQPHGLKYLADLGNEILKNSLASGDIKLEAWIDGTLSADCEWSLAWMSKNTDRNPDCTPKYATDMPFMLPAFSSRPVLTVILDAALDPTTLRMTGHIDKSDFAEGLKDQWKTVEDGLIEDVDTNSDGTPDKVSVILDLGLSNN